MSNIKFYKPPAWLNITVAVLTVTSLFGTIPFGAKAAEDIPSGGLKLEQWKTISGADWINGALNSTNSDYSEGEVVPFRLTAPGTNGTQYQFSICRNYESGAKKGYLFIDVFDTSRSATAGGTITSTNGVFKGVNVVIDNVTEVNGQGACSAGDRETIITFTKNSGTSYILWGGHLAAPSDSGVGDGNGASSFPGGSLHMKLLSPSKDSGIQTSAIIVEPTPQYTLDVTTAGSGTGSVTSDVVGINCPGDCTELYDENTVITLTASASGNSSFTGWSGACTGSSSTCAVTMDASKSVTATFTLKSYLLDVTINGTGTGTVTSDIGAISCLSTCSDTYNHGEIVTLTATEGVGSTFIGWGGVCSGNAATCAVTMDAAKSVVATFNLIPPPNQYTLTSLITGNGSGSISSSPAGIDCPSTGCAANYDDGTPVTLTASAGPNSIFTGWSGAGCSGISTCAVTMTENKTVTANFVLVQHTLTVTIIGTGAGTVTSDVGAISCDEGNTPCNKSYDYGTPVVLTAVADTGSTFIGWTVDCTGVGTCGVTMDGNKNVTAEFAINTYVLDVTINGTGTGTVTSDIGAISCLSTCSDTYNHGEIVTLTATEGVGSTFIGWGGVCSGNAATCAVTMDAAKSVVATFDITPPDTGTIEVCKYEFQPLTFVDKIRNFFVSTAFAQSLGLSGWTFNITGTNNYSNSAVTDGTGCVQFTTLPYGTYSVSEEMQAGWNAVNPATGSADVNLNDNYELVKFYNEKEDQPPVSKFDDNRNYQVISSQIYELSLSGNSEDLPNPGGSGVASAEMSIYRIVDSETAQGEGYYGEQQSEQGFYSTTCNPLPYGAVLIGSEPINLTLASTSDPMVVTWAHPFTTPDLGVYCAIVHATDNNGNVENTAVAGPFAFNPPAPTPPCTVNCGGGGGGGGGGGSPLADLGVTIDIPGGNPTAGGSNFTYLVTLTNYGPSNATNSVVTNVLPGVLGYITSSASQGSYDSATNKWNVGTLPVGSSVTLNLTVALGAGVTGSVSNFASAISSENDPVLANNTDTYVFDLGEVVPTPQVLGATTELPRTGGMPIQGMLYFSWLAPFLERFRARKLKK